GALNLRNDKGLPCDFFCRRTHCFNIRCALDERLANRIHSRVQRELETFTVASRERADPELDPGQIQSFTRSQLTANCDHALNIVLRHTLNYQLDQTIIEK